MNRKHTHHFHCSAEDCNNNCELCVYPIAMPRHYCICCHLGHSLIFPCRWFRPFIINPIKVLLPIPPNAHSLPLLGIQRLPQCQQTRIDSSCVIFLPFVGWCRIGCAPEHHLLCTVRTSGAFTVNAGWRWRGRFSAHNLRRWGCTPTRVWCWRVRHWGLLGLESAASCWICSRCHSCCRSDTQGTQLSRRWVVLGAGRETFGDWLRHRIV